MWLCREGEPLPQLPGSETSATGVASFPGLPVGSYRVRGFLNGFRMIKDNVVLVVTEEGTGEALLELQVWVDMSDTFIPVTPTPTPLPCGDAA